MRTFHIGDILSVSHDRLVSPRHIAGVYDILNFMTGDNLFTHQLPRASRECKPHLLRQLPWLEEISAEHVDADNWEAWLAEIVERHGEEHEVEPLPTGAHVVRDPVRELEEMVGPEKVITVGDRHHTN